MADDDVDRWVATVGQYCPWDARVVAITNAVLDPWSTPGQVVAKDEHGRTPRPTAAVLMTRSAPHGAVVWVPPHTAILTALALLGGSLLPSLLPRPWYLQGFISGLAVALGYGIGAALANLARSTRRHLPPGMWRAFRLGSLVSALALLIWAVVTHYRWQVDVRRLMEMEPGVGWYLSAALASGLTVGYLLVVAARLVGKGFGVSLRLLQRVMTRAWAFVVVVITTLLILILGFDVLVAGRAVSAISQAYLASDRRFDSDVRQPDSPARAGGPGSLIEWERMGRQGRAFVTAAPELEELEEFNSETPLEPIRIYVGLQSADSPLDRAELALAELERTGAFEREIVLLIAPTGTGWIDPYAVDPLEYMYNGDTAAVAIQYSHLPSWALVAGNQDLAIEACRALFEAVRDHLDRLPVDSRPRLLLYGESLGSFGWEALFEGVSDVVRETDGALWVGPPRFNRIWQTLVSHRDESSPIWRPVYEEGRTVRFGPDGNTLSAPPGPWLEPRIIYLQHASDPITWLSTDLLLQRPEWMNEPRGPDVSPEMPYVTVVTYWQLVVDLVMGTNAPIGHGHKFGPAQAEAWSLLVPPDGWSRPDTERLLSVAGDGAR